MRGKESLHTTDKTGYLNFSDRFLNSTLNGFPVKLFPIKALYEYLLNIARNDNVDSIELNVWAFNKSALKFYESLGMTVKNMKLENILSNNNVDIEKQELIITNKVSQ